MKIIEPVDIAIEGALLKAMSVRKNYDMYEALINHKRLLPNTALLLKDYKKYYKEYTDHDQVDWGCFFTEFSQKWHNKDLDDLDIGYYRDTVIPYVQKVTESDTNSTMNALLGKQVGEDIEHQIKKGFNSSEILGILEEYENKRTALVSSVDDDECYSIDKVDFSVLDKSQGIPYFLPSLQAGLGSLTKGQFVVVSADYGTGKSAFVISQAVKAFKWLHKTKSDRPILYFNSEGTEADVFGRFLSCLYSKHIDGGFEAVFNDIENVKERFCKKFNYKNFLVFQISGSGLLSIQKKIEQYKPSLVIIDITDVLAKEEDVMNLKKIFDGLRLMSGQYCPIIGTTQAGDQSYFDKSSNEIKNRKWLSDKALYGSKTGKGGSADTIITIGKDDDNPSIRYITTPKKKRGQIVSTTVELIDRFSLYKELM